MFLDSRTLINNATIETDICVIGGGAAGITLAREFARQPFKVAVLESGGMEMDSATQQLEKVVNVGRSYPKLQRLRPRFFGGATGLWGGHIVPLRAVNFEKLDWMPYSGWPFPASELEPYYNRAAALLRIKDYQHNASAEDVARETGRKLFPFDPKHVETVTARYVSSAWNKAPSVGELLYDEVKELPNVDFYLHTIVTGIRSAKDGSHITHLDATTLKGNRLRVRAKYFVLATGGIENPRVLLLSDDVFPRGVGNTHDIVGRFFMEHITYINGAIIPKNPEQVLSHYGHVVEHAGKYFRCHIAMPEDTVRKRKIPDFRSEIIIADKPKPGWFEQLLDDVHNWSLDFHILDSRIIRKLRPYMKWDANLSMNNSEENRAPAYRLSNYVEQVPNPDSRITLAGKRDLLGQKMAKVDWRLSELDRHGIRVAHGIIRDEVLRSGFGHMDVQLPDTEDEILAGAKGGAHHMGTTRMSDNPREGVVDANARVHGLPNLFVAGASVFPTGGYANPTFTILAMTVRLADHMKKLLG